jgi:hypothetical protein
VIAIRIRLFSDIDRTCINTAAPFRTQLGRCCIGDIRLESLSFWAPDICFILLEIGR